tara:strand:+ start:1227 stop:1487 length:261 start_codon:yes stop_codon:yes gene_type:complete
MPHSENMERCKTFFNDPNNNNHLPIAEIIEDINTARTYWEASRDDVIWNPTDNPSNCFPAMAMAFEKYAKKSLEVQTMRVFWILYH